MSAPDPSPPRFTPFVPEETDLPELTVRAVVIGVLMAIVLGAANAYLGMRAGLTVAATFPAAVVAMAALRGLGGSVLEENISRTTASVGEALVAGGHLHDTRLRDQRGLGRAALLGEHRHHARGRAARGAVHHRPAPHHGRRGGPAVPESVAAAELVKAGQGRQTGAKYVFQAMGIAGAWELVENSYGLQIVRDSATTFVNLGRSTVEMLGQPVSYAGGFILQSPAASPALVGVGFIVGPRIASTVFAGAVLGWLLLVPLGLFLNPDAAAETADGRPLMALGEEVWLRQIRRSRWGR